MSASGRSSRPARPGRSLVPSTASQSAWPVIIPGCPLNGIARRVPHLLDREQDVRAAIEHPRLLGQLFKFGIHRAIVRIEVAAMGKKMLSLTINGAAEKIIRETLAGQAAPSRFLIAPGQSEAPAGRATAPAAAKGSVQETALANPMVQRAREILHAEVRSVVDLRERLLQPLV